MAKIQRTTLTVALHSYVRDREVAERAWGYTRDSIHLYNIREALKALEAGESLEIIGDE